MQERVKQLFGMAAKDIMILVLGSAVGLAALLTAYALPVAPMQEHVWRSLDMLEDEFEREELVEGYPATMAGNFTDCLMLGNAVYDGGGHSVWEQAFYAYRAESGQGDGWATGYSLTDYLCGNAAGQREVEYSRYWHGYLIVLKPLLCLTTFGTIRVLASIVQLLLFGGVMLLCGKRGEERLAAAFGVSMPFLYFLSLYASLSLSVCFYIMSVSVLIQLAWHERLQEKDRYAVFFLLTGMATAYFDLLTYPLVVLGFTLCVYLYLESGGWRRCLRRGLGFCVQWSAGYLGLWAMKWILTDLLAGGHTIAVAAGALAERTGGVEEQSFLGGLGTVLGKNADAYANWAFVLLGIFIAVWGCRCIFKSGRRFWRCESLMRRGVILAVAFFPLAWYALTQNHSYEHAVFTYRNFALSVFAVCCAVGADERDGSAAGEARPEKTA